MGLALRTVVRTARPSAGMVPRRGLAAGPPAKYVKSIQEGSTEWWGKYNPSYGYVSKQLSPYELNPMKTLFSDLPHKIQHRLEKPIFDILPALLLLVGTVKWANADFERR